MVRENIKRIEWCDKERKVTLYDKGKVLGKYDPIFMNNNKTIDKTLWLAWGTFHPKEQNKARCEYLGTSSGAFRKVWNGCVYHNYVAPLRKKNVPGKGHNIFDDFFYSKYRLKTQNISWVYDNIDMVEELYKKGSRNIVPFVLSFKESPKELKKRFGKGVWKRLCKNTFHRNKLIVSHISYRGHDKQGVHNLLYSRSKAIELFYSSTPEVIKYLSDNMDSWKDEYEGEQIKDYYCDTNRMAGMLGIEFNPNWRYKRLKEEHNKMAKELAYRKERPFDFEWMSILDFSVKELTLGEFKATLLTNSGEVKEEALVMKHCVASYIPLINKGQYMVYSITLGGVRYSTLGVEINAEGAWFDQHYKAYNRSVDHKDATELADKVVSVLRGGDNV